MSNRKASLIAGMLAGVTGLLVFLVIHHLWIKPIWFILPVGLVIAVLGGLAIGSAYCELLPRLPGRPWTIFAWFSLICLTLAPAVILAQLRPPLFTGSGMNVIASISVAQAIVIFVRDLLLPAAVIGGLAGWLIGRTKRAALKTALAGFMFALGPGHNIPFLGNQPSTGKGIILLISIVLAASIVMIEGHAALHNKISRITMTTKLTSFANNNIYIRRVAIGAFLGLAWGASLRAWMALLALKFGEHLQFTWEGTFGAILLPTAIMGAILGGVTCVAETSNRKLWRWAILLPLLLILGPVIVTNNFIKILVTTGMGGGAIGVALIGVLGGYSFSGFGAQWTRWISGFLSLFFTLGSVYGVYIAAGSATVTPGVNEAFGALLFILLMAFFIAGVSAPSRFGMRQHISSRPTRT